MCYNLNSMLFLYSIFYIDLPKNDNDRKHMSLQQRKKGNKQKFCDCWRLYMKNY